LRGRHCQLWGKNLVKDEEKGRCRFYPSHGKVKNDVGEEKVDAEQQGEVGLEKPADIMIGKGGVPYGGEKKK